MKTLNFKISPLIFTLIFIYTELSYSQSRRFPDCRDVEITNIETTLNDLGKLDVTVYNNCDTCTSHVYTGIRIFKGSKVVAEDENFQAESSPENNEAKVYTLIKNTEFELNENLRIEMFQICDSIPFTSILNSEEPKINDLGIQLFPNPFEDEINILVPDEIKIKEWRLLNIEGKLLFKLNNKRRKINMDGIPQGIYILRILTETENIDKKIVKK